ncbi:hypothetical protein [Spiroplasma endosymbiont of Glossina fuscipes fuscipes]
MMQKRVKKQSYYFLNNSKINLYKITPKTKQESKGCDNKNDN